MVLSEGAHTAPQVWDGAGLVRVVRGLSGYGGMRSLPHPTQQVHTSPPQPAPGWLLSQPAPQPGESALGSHGEGGADPGLDGGSCLAVALVGATLDALDLRLGIWCCCC